MSISIDTSFNLEGYIESNVGGRAENQDSSGAMQTALGTVVVVCDGMGGLNGGRVASMLAVKTIIDDVSIADPSDDPKAVLNKAFLHAHSVIREESSKASYLGAMGTTATAVIISDHCATIAHIGDSRIYQFRSGKKIYRTTDHSMVFELVAAGTLTEEQARLSAQSNVILKALGVNCDPTPSVATLPYLKRDRFVLCTDGFWGMFPEGEFVKLITRRGDLKDVLWDATKAINKCGIDSGGGHDNLTAAVFDLKCESKLKPQMSKKQKIAFIFLTLLLLFSVAANVVSYRKMKEYAPKIQLNDENVKSLMDTTSTAEDIDEFKTVNPN